MRMGAIGPPQFSMAGCASRDATKRARVVGRLAAHCGHSFASVAADKDVGWPTALMSPGVGLSAAPSSFTSLRRPPNILVWRRWWRPIVEYGSSVAGAGRWGALRSEVKGEGAPAGRRRGT